MEKRKKFRKYAQKIVRVVGVILIITMLIVCTILQVSADTSWSDTARVAGTNTMIWGHTYNYMYSDYSTIWQSLPMFTGEIEQYNYALQGNENWTSSLSRGTEVGDMAIDMTNSIEGQAQVTLELRTIDTYIPPVQNNIVTLDTEWSSYDITGTLNVGNILGTFYTNGSELEYEFEYEPFVYVNEMNGITYHQYYLNFYWILLNSNIDWELYVPNDIPATEFYDTIENLTYYDILNPDNEDMLESLFSEIEVIYIPYASMSFYGEYTASYESIGYITFNINGNQTYYRWDEAYELRNIDIIYNGILWDSPNAITLWLGRAVAGFMDVEIMPFFTFGGLIVIIITFSLVLWWLKVFAGG